MNFKNMTFASKNRIVLGALLLIVLLAAGAYFIFGGNGDDAAVADTHTRQVTLSSIAALASSKATLPVIGTVHSQSEAILRTEKSGEVTAVYAHVGDTVGAGAVLAEIENASERASVAQAAAFVAQAQASYDKLTRGVRNEQLSVLTISRDNAESSLRNAETGAQTTVQSAYAAIDDTVTRLADEMFSNPRSSNPSFNITASDSQLATNLVAARIKIEGIMKREAGARGTLSASNVDSELKTTEAELQTVKAFFDTLAAALNRAISTGTVSDSDIAGYKVSAATGRTTILANLSAVTAAEENLSNRRSALEIAEKNLTQGQVGGQSEDVRAADAGLKQAEASLALARANYEKSVVRTPISGKVNTLTLSKGSFVGSFEPAATVSSSNGGLEIVAYVSDREKNSIVVGAKAQIEGKYAGVVTSVAPGLDPATKKVEIKVGVTDKAAVLTQGSTVRIDIERTGGTPVASTNGNATSTELFVPLTAVKIGATETTIFTVDENMALVPHVVTLGSVVGGKVLLLTGATPDMVIVTDARGFKPGDVVVEAGAAAN